MSPDERKPCGAKLNVLKDAITEAILTKKATLAEAALERQAAKRSGRRHAAAGAPAHRRDPSRVAK